MTGFTPPSVVSACWSPPSGRITHRSTLAFLTFSKAMKRIPLEEWSGRTEPLVVKGPYQYVRHPLYSGVLLLLLGWWLLLDFSFILVSTLLLLLWFSFVVAPFEEKELRAMFGEDYERYARRVSRIIPFTTCHKKGE